MSQIHQCPRVWDGGHDIVAFRTHRGFLRRPTMIAILLFACVDPAEEPLEPVEPDLALIGDWVDDFGGTHAITAATWTMGASVFAITQFDNDTSWLVAQNDADNEFSPDLWSRMDWSAGGADFWFCQTVFDGADEAAALGATPADSADLTAGCGGFSWSMLSTP